MRMIRIWWMTHLLNDLRRKQRAADAARRRLFKQAARWERHSILAASLIGHATASAE